MTASTRSVVRSTRRWGSGSVAHSSGSAAHSGAAHRASRVATISQPNRMPCLIIVTLLPVARLATSVPTAAGTGQKTADQVFQHHGGLGVLDRIAVLQQIRLAADAEADVFFSQDPRRLDGGDGVHGEVVHIGINGQGGPSPDRQSVV